MEFLKRTILFLTPYVFGFNLPTLPQLSQRLIISHLVILLSVEDAEGYLRQLAGEWGVVPNKTKAKMREALTEYFLCGFETKVIKG
jgi:hypothetical protein